jgi:hypothetical protein
LDSISGNFTSSSDYIKENISIIEAEIEAVINKTEVFGPIPLVFQRRDDQWGCELNTDGVDGHYAERGRIFVEITDTNTTKWTDINVRTRPGAKGVTWLSIARSKQNTFDAMTSTGNDQFAMKTKIQIPLAIEIQNLSVFSRIPNQVVFSTFKNILKIAAEHNF